jgi:TolB-like protein
MADRLKRLIREIHRRSLWQVLGIYAVASWAVLQVVDTLGGALNLPEWFPSFALALLIVGLPIVLATAFVQEGGPGHADETPDGAEPTVFTWRNALGGGVLAFALWGVVAAGWVMFGAATRQPSESDGSSIEASVAVMPCDDQTPARDQAALAQGLADGIINALARLPDLKVSGMTSAIAMRAADADARTVADALDVATVLECGLQQADDVVRIRPRLVEAATGRVLWSDEIDQQAGNVFAIQDEVARAVAIQLQVVFAGSQEGRLVAAETESGAAQRAYTRGRYLLYRRTEQSLRNAAELYQEAIDADPEFAAAYAGLAQASLLLTGYALDPDSLDVAASIERGLLAARTAVSLAPDLGLAHVALGMAAVFGGAFEEARRELSLAISLSPGSADAHASAATINMLTGHSAEAVALAERAVSLDPVNPQFALTHVGSLRASGRVDEATRRSRELVELAPNYANGWHQLFALLLDAGMYDGALDAWINLGRAWAVEDLTSWREAFREIRWYRETGEPGTLPELSRVPYQYHGWMAVHLGRHRQAIEWLSDVLDRGAYVYVALFDSNVGASLRDDPDYDALRRRAGITW